ncbi:MULTISPECIES: NAD/NADP-dependent octopine/nopaline dehydrogenase family protein [unclassified Brenneria]|uniref:NAD/NADP-dependent octopine/nopaline dehydrogenase family protein n=1 Tax=unclassified Brenneria TaxID=2634434 RepID=UPI0018F0BF6F|nr:NAD/NADP-dependent octopine/nopaline dehydrogenase family protein [Brenneria sp. L3-3C-1]MBJ7223536.1 NAD/NADP octopine/nopaline dehydrogenase family protein [Brenneria sp. L3-3C-1]MEE3644777.1 NAD/NADP octopine/nopaline dehydrogenase family protein [Brenneria sp. L3_3C_1]
MNMSVSIIGAGHCGCAFAADLLDRGARVLLYAHPNHRSALDAIEDNGGLLASGMIDGVFHPELSTDIGDAVRFSRYLVVTVPAYAHDDVISALSKHDLNAHFVICITGNFFSLAARRALNAAAILETSSAPYASRIEGATATILGIKSAMPIASLLPISDAALRDCIARTFSMPLQWHRHVLEIGFSCITAVVHPVPTLMNAGWIESTGGDFYFYRNGMSRSVVRVMEGVDEERRLIAKQYGFSLPTTVELMNRYYQSNYADLADFANRSPEHNRTKMAPASLRHRFIAQDVPYVLVPWYEFGRAAGIEAPSILSVIQIASLIHNVNYLETGRTLGRLDLHQLDKHGIQAALGVSVAQGPSSPPAHIATCC